jgi:predicted ribosome quality control (RQC) complex YloA/Tae2 family protein
MDIKYLIKWIEENDSNSLIIKELRNYRNQYCILFKQTKLFLQMNLLTENPFCFFTEKKILPFVVNKESERWNQILNHAVVKGMTIRENERIIIFNLTKTDIYNVTQEMRLILELIPRFQNMILIDSNQKILIAKRVFSYADNPFRQILPGQEYQFPPVHSQSSNQLVNYPIEIKSPNLIIENSTSNHSFKNTNDFLENYYYHYLFTNETEQKRKQLLQNLKKEIEKKQKKIAKLKIELNDAEKVDKWKHDAELLKSKLHIIKPGATEISVIDYYQPDMRSITIPVQQKLSPQENLNYYFKKYRKARDGKEKISKQIELTEMEIDELEKEEFEIQELEWQDFSQENDVKKKKQNQIKRLKNLKWCDDWEILIGRTSKENDFLTTKLAQPHDLWFHTRVFRGTHVILRNFNKKAVSENLIRICTGLAAYYSKAKFSENVPVDYTEIRFVRKPRGSAPGFVTYSNQKTVFVNPLDSRKALALLGEI